MFHTHECSVHVARIVQCMDMIHPVMQAYGSLASEDNSKVGEAVVGSDVIFPASAPVPSSSQPKKQTHSLQWVHLEEDLLIFPNCEVGVPGRTN